MSGGGGGGEDTEYLKLSVEDRCTHKLWKARVSGYEEATKNFARWDGDDPAFKKFAPLIKKFVTDSNAIAQEKGLEAALEYARNCDSAARVGGDVAEGLVAKCLGAPKAKTRDLAKEIALALCEQEAHERILEELLTKGITQKNPKVVSGCLSTLTDCLKAFGAKVVKVSPLLKATLPLLDHRDKNVRDEGKKLIVESYHWVGAIMKQQLSGLKPVQLTELEAEFEKVESEAGRAKPERYLKSQRPAVPSGFGGAAGEEGVGDHGDGGDGQVEEEALDPYDLMDPVDITSKLPKNFYELVAEKKWQLRKEALDAVLPLTQTPKIVPNPDLNELSATLRKLVAKDTNVMLVAQAAQCLTGLAKGLRGAFKAQAAMALSVTLEKFKEKKPAVVAALSELSDALYPCLGIEAIQEDCLGALKHKTPSVVACTARLLARCFATCPPQLATNKKALKGYVSALLERLAHQDGGVRDAASEALGVLLKYLGEQNVGKLMIDVDAIKIAKIKEFAEKAELTGKPVKVAPAQSAPQKAGKSNSIKAKVVKPPENDDTQEELGDDNQESAAAPAPTKKKVSVNKPVIDKSKVRSRIGNGSGSSATTRKPTATAGTAASKLVLKPSSASGSKKKSEDSENDSSPLYVDNQLKKTRFKEEAKLKVLKWNFSTPRQEFVDQLKDQMTTASFNQTLMTQMFHSDFKQHLKAIEALSSTVGPNNVNALKANLDLILKWMTLRFFETNPSVLLKGLSYLLDVFNLLSDCDYQMHEVEAVSFVPYLVNKVGDPKDPVRNSVKSIVRKMGNVYPASKMSAFLMAGLSSKNAKQRAECLDELCHLIRGHGSGVLQPSVPQSLKEIAKQISDRDNGVRNAALNCIAETYFQDGDKLYRVIGNLKEKDMTMLEERIKRQAKTRPPPGSGGAPAQNGATNSTAGPRINPPPAQQPERPATGIRTRPATAGGVPVDGPPPPTSANLRATPSKGPRPISGAFTLDLEKIESAMDRLGNSDLKLVNHKLDDILNDEPIRLPQTMTKRQYSPPSSSLLGNSYRLSSPSNGTSSDLLTSMPEALEALDVTLAQIFNQDPQACIKALAELDELIKDEEKVALLGQRMDKLLVACYMQYRHVLNTRLTGPDSAGCDPKETMKLFQFLTMVLMSVYHHQDLAKKASMSSLHDLLHIILCVLLEHKVQELPHGDQLARALNVLTVKIVERSDHTRVTSAFLRLLREAIANGSLAPKYTDLVMKCLWKVIKLLPSWINDVDLDTILCDVHAFLKAFPSSYWKRQEGVADTPLRTMKTILHTLTKVKGEEVLEHLTKVPDPENSEIVPYLHKLLSQGVGKENNNGNSQQPQPNNYQLYFQKSSTATAVAAARFSKSDHEALADIFKKIGQKEQTKLGLKQLYDFKRKNPSADLEPFLAKSSQYFRDYIERGLQSIEREQQQAGGPPAASLGLGSDSGEASVAPAGQNILSGNSQATHCQYLERLRKLREQGGLS